MKINMTREQVKISSNKTKMQATIAGINAQENNDEDWVKKMQAGFCWEDADLRTIGLDPNILPLQMKPLMMKFPER